MDRQSTQWQQAPAWVKLGLFGINTRSMALKFEKVSAIIGIISLGVSYFYFIAVIGILMFASAYGYAVAIRWVDNNNLW